MKGFKQNVNIRNCLCVLQLLAVNIIPYYDDCMMSLLYLNPALLVVGRSLIQHRPRLLGGNTTHYFQLLQL